MPLTDQQKLTLEVKSLKKKLENNASEAVSLLTNTIKDVVVHGKDGADGEKGDKGDRGAPGPKGDKGDPGQDGKKGPKGDRGIQGPKGDKGDVGPKGDKGDKGDVGDKGLKGDKGAPGKDGKKGLKGDRGLRGLKGDNGKPPKHEIKEGKIRFEKPDGKWGKWIDLKSEGGVPIFVPGGGGGVNNISDIDAIDLTDGGSTTLHKHFTEDIIYSESISHLDNLQEVINHMWSTGGSGRAEDFVITENGDGTIDITGGDAVLRSTEDPDGELKAYIIPGVTNLPLTDNATNYILVDYNNGNPTITASANINDVVNVITKTTIYAINRLGNNLNIVDIRAFNVDFMRKNAIKDYKVYGFEHAGGAFVSDLSSRNIAVTASEFYLLNQPIQSPALDTSTTGTFEYVYQDGLGGYTRVASQTQIDNLNYDDGSGTLAVVGTNKYFCHYVYLVLNNPSHYKVVYGRELHNQLAAAQAEQVPSTLPSDLDPLSTAVFIGKIIVLQGVDAFEDIQSPFTQVLTSSAATNHNNLAGLQGGAVSDYQHLTTAEVTLVNGAIQSTEKGAANGVATLGASGKIPSAQLPSSVMEYKGNWDASTNTPTLIDGTGDNGDIYRVNVAGTQDLGSGSQTFSIGDWVVYNGTIWERSDNADAVSSVNSQVGTVVLDADDIDDSATAHKFVTSTDLTNLSNLSGINSGDVTVTDTSEIDLTLTGQDIQASIIASSIDESKLDASVNASLDLADSAVQQNDSPTFNQITTTGKIVVDNTANSTSPTTGSIQTDGGLGVAGNGYFGGGLYSVSNMEVTGPAPFLRSTGTIQTAVSLYLTDGPTNRKRFEFFQNVGGITFRTVNDAYTAAHNFMTFYRDTANDYTVTRLVYSANAIFENEILCIDTTESTSTTTGSIRTNGGLGVVKNIWAGEYINVPTGKGVKVNGTQVLTDQQSALTTAETQITHTAPGAADYAIQDMTNASPYGFATQDEANTVLQVIKNLQVRVDELETKLKAHGLIA